MKTLLLALSLGLSVASLFAQPCTPSWSGTGSGIQPNTTTNLPHATEATPYAAVIQFKVPTDTLFIVPTTINFIRIDSVVGLASIPSVAAFDYASNPDPAIFPGGSLGCVAITGTPAAGSAGTYPISVFLTINATNALVTGFEQKDTVTGYAVVVDQAVGVNDLDVKNGLVAFPSKTDGVTALNYFTNGMSNVEINVFNLLGQNVTTIVETSRVGINTTSLDLSAFPSGQYIVTLRTDDRLFTTKVLLSK